MLPQDLPTFENGVLQHSLLLGLGSAVGRDGQEDWPRERVGFERAVYDLTQDFASQVRPDIRRSVQGQAGHDVVDDVHAGLGEDRLRRPVDEAQLDAFAVRHHPCGDAGDAFDELFLVLAALVSSH